MKHLAIVLLIIFSTCLTKAQQYTGMSGLLQTPSAEMYNSGDARIGAHFLNYHTLPWETFAYKGDHYNTVDFYASVTPFSWIEIGYTIILRKGSRGQYGPDDIGYHRKDQFFSLKVRPLKEGKWWPSIALGTNDPITTGDYKGRDEVNRNQHFGNYYISATKHFDKWNQTFGVTLSYRRFVRKFNHRWNGVIGGITYRPSFFKNSRAVVEWTGSEINLGVDCLLFSHLMLQASLFDGKYFSGGLCYTVNLF